MLLAIDVGNTHIFYGLHDGSDWRATWRQHTNPAWTEDEIGAFLSTMTQRACSTECVDRMAVCSVVPALSDRFLLYARRWLEIEPLFITHLTAKNLPILNEPPEMVGADRIANAVAAIEQYGVPAVVVDMGTATTFDAISAKGEYLGGAIMPGVEISTAALFHRAARLSKISLTVPRAAIGRNTEESLRSGIVLGFAAAIDGLVERICSELGGNPVVVATGGVADTIVGACRSIHHVDPMLTLNGIRILAEP
ncbi:MAG: type III pantothenate kinase [Fimbriimonadales bacterium]